MNNFWENLPDGFRVLAPMEDVTDTVFRQIVLSCGQKDAILERKMGSKAGQPDVFFTEFSNVEGLQSTGRDRLIHRLKFAELERPIIAQIWGKSSKHYREIAEQIVEMGFDGVDINMGCPERSVVKQGACSALIQNPELAREIIQAVKDGVGGKIPVSVKTRIGFSMIDTENWCGFLLDQKLDALTIHGRTVKEMSDVPAHWDEIAKVVQIRDANNLKTKIIGNGDVGNTLEADKKVEEYGVDGVMIGRGIFHNIFAFNPEYRLDDQGFLYHGNQLVSPQQKLDILLEHTKLWHETWLVKDPEKQFYRSNKTHYRYQKNFSILKKFFKIYCSGFSNAVELRIKLMECNDLDEVEKVVMDFRHESI
jgi:tRNA-dihydrouridine synthase